MQKLLITMVLAILCGANAHSQEAIRWYSIEQAEALVKKEKRKIIIDIVTSWCTSCKTMERTTLTQQNIVKYINDNFYPVKLDAEQHNNINFRNKTYKFVTQSGVGFNELASEFLKGQLSYPTIVVLDENLDLIQAMQGFQAADQFEKIMTYFGENNHKKMPWAKYERTFSTIKNR